MDDFMELIKQVGALAISLKAKFEKENVREKSNDTKTEELSTRETTAVERDTDLNQRETKVQGIESIVQLKQDAITLRKNAEKIMAEAVEQREKDALVNKAAKDANIAEKKRLADANVRHLEDLKSLAKGWDQLRAKEKTYKEEINAQIKGLGIK